MAMGGGIRRNSGTELKLYLGCTGSTSAGGKYAKQRTQNTNTTVYRLQFILLFLMQQALGTVCITVNELHM